MKNVLRVFGIAVIVLCFANLLPAQKPFTIDLGINFGLTLGSKIGESTYNYGAWESYFVFVDVERGTIAPELSNPLSLGGNISLITQMGIGVQFALDMNMASNITGTSAYTVDAYDWWYAQQVGGSEEWPVDGTLKMMALSFDVIYKYSTGMISPWFAAGLTYGMATVEADSRVGFGFEDGWYDFDYVAPGVEIVDGKLSGIGFNAGAGVDIQFSPNLAFCVEARYFMFGEKEINWMTVTGETLSSYNYDLDYRFQDDVFQFLWSYTIDWPKVYTWDWWWFEGADELNDLITPVKINPSFFKVAGGIKISF